jgi:hypothetical protein
MSNLSPPNPSLSSTSVGPAVSAVASTIAKPTTPANPSADAAAKIEELLTQVI